MAIDFAALKAKIAAKTVEAQKENEQVQISKAIAATQASISQGNSLDPASSPNSSVSSNSLNSGNVPSSVGTVPAKVPEAPSFISSQIASEGIPLDHIAFLEKLNSLHTAIHTAHPSMPLLLKQIHSQLLKDPEIVTLLNEDAIGVIVQGLQKQTQTELIGAVAKQSKAKDKKTTLALDMF